MFILHSTDLPSFWQLFYEISTNFFGALYSIQILFGHPVSVEEYQLHMLPKKKPTQADHRSSRREWGELQ